MLATNITWDNTRAKIEALNSTRLWLQGMITLANLAGNQKRAHRLSKKLCYTMEALFKLKPVTRKKC